MKKLVFWLFVLMFVSVSVAFSFPGFKTRHSVKLGIEFSYPKRLKVWEKDGRIIIEHKISFEHPNPCDGSGLSRYEKSKKIFDFYVEMSILEKTPNEIFVQEVMGVKNGVTVLRNSVRVTFGDLDGFRVYNGNHGCGPYSYFFQLTNSNNAKQRVKFLRVDRFPAPEFRELSEEEKQIFYRLREIISPKNEEDIFKEILNSLKWSQQ